MSTSEKATTTRGESAITASHRPSRTLPTQLTPFIGRDDDLAEIGHLLEDLRLVSLIGAGGCGKTRLAIEAAARNAGRHADGVWWVDLAPLADPGLIDAALATALGVREPPGRPLLDAITDELRDRRALLLLDNCEHVVAAAARACEQLLRGCPGVTLLATSRELLGVDGEAHYPVRSLTVPEADVTLERGREFEAVRLFVERGRAARPGFDAHAETWPAIRSICEQLDGMPLALELAAARLRVLSPEQVADGLGERLALLTGGRRTALPRHRTLEQSVAWSYDLLDDDERTTLQRASVFAGGFEIEAAEAVCAADGAERETVLDLLARLIDKSLVQCEHRGSTVRYRLLETIRQYAQGRLLSSDRELAGARNRHLDYYTRLTEQAAPQLEGGEQLEWLDRLDLEHDNLRAAADWAAQSGAADREVRMAGAMWMFWVFRGHLGEGFARLDSAIDTGGGEPRARGLALVAKADLVACLAGDYASAREPSEEALAIGRDTSDHLLEGRALILLAWSELPTAGPGARSTLRRGIDATTKAGDVPGHSFCLNALGFLELYTGEIDEAREHLEEALGLARQCGNRKAIYMALAFLGQLQAETGEFEAAERTLLEGVATARELGDPLLVSSELAGLGGFQALRGDFEAARRSIGEALTMSREHGMPVAVAMSLAELSALEARRGENKPAFAAGEEAVGIGRAFGLKRYLARWLVARAEGAVAEGDVAVTQRCWEEAVSAGQEVGDRWVLGVARHGLARVALERGEPAEAESLVKESLGTLAECSYRPAAIEALETLAAVYFELGAPDRAARLVGTVDSERASRGQPRPPSAERRLEHLFRAVSASGLETDRVAGAAMTIDEAIAYAARGRGSRQRPAEGWASLTPAELEVSRLVAEGLTNPQIGERLFISKRTVQTHLSHVFRKLGASKRAEVAAEVVRRQT